MRPYIFTERNGIHIIDLQQTVKSFNSAYTVLRDCVSEGGTILFVGTKRQAQETVREEAIRCGMPYVTERWLGGMLTNWVTIFQRITELERLEKMRDTGEFERLTKKEGLLLERAIKRLDIRLSGVRNLKRLPDMLFIVDVNREETAVHEANLTGIPIVALVDTNCDPGGVDYVIPSNDDAIRAIKLLVAKIADAVIEGKSMRKDDTLEGESGISAEVEVTTPNEHPKIDLEDGKPDADLFGAATLAKLSVAAAEEIVDEPEISSEEEEK